MKFQRTIKRPVSLSGIGLHSGKPVQVRLLPAKPNRGIVFVRTDLEGRPEVTAHFKNVVSTQLATTVASGFAKVSTVEHLLAALFGFQIDNLVIEVDGPELPILDGSSAQFSETLERAGIETQRARRACLVLRKKVELKVAEKWAVAEPSARLEVLGSIDWDHPSIGFQEFRFVQGVTKFDDICAARTFGFIRDLETMRAAGLAKGGSFDNAVVLDDSKVLNPGGLRFADEFVRHKILDALGDFKLAGIEIQAFIRLHRAGHELHCKLLEAIFSDQDNYEILDGSEQESIPTGNGRAVSALSRFVASF